jgi:hypothetical protein
MRGICEAVEPHRAEQAIAAPCRRFAGLPCFSNRIRLNLRTKQPLHKLRTPHLSSPTNHFPAFGTRWDQTQNSSTRNYSAAFLLIPSLATKLLQMELIHPIQTDKYED